MVKDVETGAVFVVAWSQTRIDGLSGAPLNALDRGATWSWHGDAVRLDPAFTASEKCRRHLSMQEAIVNARRLITRAMVSGGQRTPFLTDDTTEEATVTITDGRHRWQAALIDMEELSRPILLFLDALPPTDLPLFVCEGPDPAWRPKLLRPRGEGVVCFTPGTKVATPDGARSVESLVAGDLVWTKDSGPQEILWIGHRHISGARLFAMPDLRPVRIRSGAMAERRPDGDLVVSPDHRILVEGASALALWGEREVLVAARDLVDDRRVLRERHLACVDYIHLLLPRHGILLANGIETESFHPAGTDLDAVSPDQLTRLFDLMPDLEITPSAYGPLSRRVLGPSEAALVQRMS